MKIIIANNNETKEFYSTKKYTKNDVVSALNEKGAKGYVVEGSNVTEASQTQIESLFD